MMIENAFNAILTPFISFFFFVFTERVFAHHQFRVGRGVSFFDFMSRTLIDEFDFLKRNVTRAWFWIAIFQASVFLFLDFHLGYLFLVYLTTLGVLMLVADDRDEATIDRIKNDAIEVRYFVSASLVIISLIAIFSGTKSMDPDVYSWRWTHIAFVAPFVVAGMMLFEEHPFRGTTPKNGWLKSFRFYAWSMVGAQLFLGGGEYVVDLHLKAALLYVVARLMGGYIQNFQKRDLLRVCVVYFFPISGALWLAIELVNVLRAH